MTKTLLVDLPSAGDPLDNVEGITLGPKLPDGRQSLLLVSDDNFSPQQITQFVAFACDFGVFGRAQRYRSRRSPSYRCRR